MLSDEDDQLETRLAALRKRHAECLNGLRQSSRNFLLRQSLVLIEREMRDLEDLAQKRIIHWESAMYASTPPNSQKEASWRKNRLQQLTRKSLTQLSQFSLPIDHYLGRLSLQDLKLCLKWNDHLLHSHRPVGEQWAEFVNLEKNKALRLWSARSAENAAIAFFKAIGKRTEDISHHQVTNLSSKWLTHDVEVDGVPIDVKNARASFSNPNSYVEHVIPQFKQSRAQALNVGILGILSDYKTWQQINNDDYGTATILGLLYGNDLASLCSWVDKHFGDFLDLGPLNVPHLKNYPGWLFDYPEEWRPNISEALNQMHALLQLGYLPNKVKTGIPIYVYAILGIEHNNPDKVQSQIEQRILHEFSTLYRDIGISRRTLYVWILGTILRTIIESGYCELLTTTAALRRFLFDSESDLAQTQPSILYDPKLYIWNLILMFEEIGRNVSPELLRSMRFYKLTAPTILRGRLSNGNWQTVYSHCGGWRLFPAYAPCGNNPIHLGNSTICPSCRRLICSECAFCMQDCPLCTNRQGQHAENQRKHAMDLYD